MNTISVGTDNVFKVPKKQWKKWSERQRTLFNDLYEMMLDNQQLFKHSSSPEVYIEYWKTTAWNAAWMAADFSKEPKNRGPNY